MEKASTAADLCQLCVEFSEAYNENGDECRGCPVRAFTKRKDCRETPYYVARSRLAGWRDRAEEEAEKLFRESARAELDFLVSLLPEDAQ
jgi:hypothetical protein